MRLPTERANPKPAGPRFITGGHAVWYDLIWDPCGLNAFLCFR